MSSVLCVIAARGGSRGVPRKNIRPMLGKPLIVWSIEQALQAPEVDHVVVSTDDAEIAEISRMAGAEVPFMRPDHLATAQAGKVAVWKHALAASETHFSKAFDLFVDLDCTGPVRTPTDISEAIAFLRRRRAVGADGAMTVTAARRNPYFNLLEVAPDGSLRESKPEGRGTMRRQDAPRCYDAVASIYVITTDFVRRTVNLFDGAIHGFEVPEEMGFDIDSELDFEIVEMIMRKRQAAT